VSAPVLKSRLLALRAASAQQMSYFRPSGKPGFTPACRRR
jgi:hypothetical protein